VADRCATPTAYHVAVNPSPTAVALRPPVSAGPEPSYLGGYVVNPTVIMVKGMTCGHCVSAVEKEISSLPGVTGVDVDLGTGTVRISADPLPSEAALRAAVDTAGYEIAD
jgi:copper chaperone